ncbi:MAG: SRPBCC family protein [Asticcacaulis sp.]
MQRQANHHIFVIEREFTHSPALVFFAWSDPQARREWFSGPADWVRGEAHSDFRVGGVEVSEGGPKGGFTSRYEGRILEIVPDERIITAFMMHIDGSPWTASLTTAEFKPGDYGTLLKYTEQIVFLDGHDHLSQRIEGTEGMFDLFEAYLEGKYHKEA